MSSIRIKVDVSGTGATVAALLRGADRVRGAVKGETRGFLFHVAGEAVTRAPVDEGTLRGSMSVHMDGRRVLSSSEMGYPGGTPLDGAGPTNNDEDAFDGAIVFNTAYATYQHERTDLNHPKGGEAKYLERAVRRNEALFRSRVAAAIRKVVQ